MGRKDWPHDKLEGPVDIEISLKEYGFAWICGETETLFYYGIYADGGEYTKFDFCVLDNALDVQSEYDWVDWRVFLSFIGGTPCSPIGAWITFPLQVKIQDLVSYYGYENVFGTSYWEGLTYSDIVPD